MRRTFAIAGAVALACASLLLAGCGGNGNGGYGSTQPPVTSNGELGSSTLASNASYQHTFNTAGRFRYHCTIHPSCTSLQGTITVVAADVPILNDVHGISFSGGTAGTYETCSMLSDQDDTVHVGESVTWTNGSPLPHTVTSF